MHKLAVNTDSKTACKFLELLQLTSRLYPADLPGGGGTYIVQETREGFSCQECSNDSLSLLHVSQDPSIIHLGHELPSHKGDLTVKAPRTLTASE